MAEKVYELGTGGVNLIHTEIGSPTTEVLSAQNTEVVMDVELGGRRVLKKRDGITPLGSALAASVAELVSIRFITSL